MVLYYIYLLLRVIRPTTPLLNLSTLYHCVYRRPFYCLLITYFLCPFLYISTGYLFFMSLFVYIYWLEKSSRYIQKGT
jgi:hypothetical protein